MKEKAIMGRVRPNHIKKVAKKLMEKYPNMFTNDFEENKKKLRGIIRTDSKKVRNRVIGYITSSQE